MHSYFFLSLFDLSDFANLERSMSMIAASEHLFEKRPQIFIPEREEEGGDLGLVEMILYMRDDFGFSTLRFHPDTHRLLCWCKHSANHGKN